VRKSACGKDDVQSKTGKRLIEALNPARATRCMAVAPHALASQSAIAVMREGGNAVEAMIAAAATIAVVYPHMNSIGGDGFWLISAPGSEPVGIEACGAAAGTASNMDVDPQALLAPAYLDALAAGVRREQAAPWGPRMLPADTVWLGAVDANSVAVSFIQSIYHEFGSGVVLPASGVNWQNRGCSFSLDPGSRHPLMPGRRPFHTLNPALARFHDGRTMVYGNMGGDGQPQSQAAVFSRIARFGWNPQAAIAAPRWLLGRTWGLASDSLKLESRFSADVIGALRKRGHAVDVLGAYDEAMGHAGAIVRHADGLLEGGADPRSDGGVAG
jgi:gamma-glutamyltranspeptidase